MDGRRLTAALRTAGARRGVTLCEGRARAVERSEDRVTAVQVGSERISAGSVVLAAGAWSGGLAGAFGVRLPVLPLKGQIVHVTAEGNPDSERWPIIQPILNFYLVPWPAGRIACGGTFEADAGFDARPTAAGLRDLLRECVAIAPGLATAAFTEARVGLRPASADERPLLGRLPGRSNVYVCTGHGAEGLLLGAYSGALGGGCGARRRSLRACAVRSGPLRVSAWVLPRRHGLSRHRFTRRRRRGRNVRAVPACARGRCTPFGSGSAGRGCRE